MRKILFIAVLLMLTGLAAGTSIAEENITVDLNDETVEAEIFFNDLTSSSFTYITNHPVEDYSVEIEGEEVECTFDSMALGGEIRCPTDYSEDFNVRLEYKTSGLTNSQNGVNIFRYSQNIYRPIEVYNFKVMLPEGTGLLDQQNISTPVIAPEDGEVGSEGRRIHVEWTREPSLGDTVSFQVTYEKLSTDFRLLIILAAALLTAIGLVKYYRERKTKGEVSAILDSLTEDERMVFELVSEEGSMLQKDIVNESDYSKAKISGVVSSLVDEGLVEKEKEGRSNRVSVKEKYRD